MLFQQFFTLFSLGFKHKKLFKILFFLFDSFQIHFLLSFNLFFDLVNIKLNFLFFSVISCFINAAINIYGFMLSLLIIDVAHFSFFGRNSKVFIQAFLIFVQGVFFIRIKGFIRLAKLLLWLVIVLIIM